MINRVLIRIKTVQLLYSHLLVENSFALEQETTPSTKESQFAYKLYLDILYLMIREAERIEKRGGVRPLFQTRFIEKLNNDLAIKSLRAFYRRNDFPFVAAESGLEDKIKESGIYKKFLKTDGDSGFADTVWQDIFEQLVVKDAAVNRLITLREGYTLRGVDRMRELIEKTFSKFYVSNDNLPDALKTLNRSMEMTRELYFRLLSLPVELVSLRERQIDDNARKFLRTSEDVNPNMRFVENDFVRTLAANPEFYKNVEDKKINWIAEDEPMLRRLLTVIMKSGQYADYMDFPATDYRNDCEFWRNVFKDIIFRNEDLLETLEDKSVFWNDDLDIVGTFILKTIRRFEDKSRLPILPMYKDEEDAKFGKELFTCVVNNKESYQQIINDTLDKKLWEADRLAFMDVVIVMTAMAEMLNFPKVPLGVTLNEYIEIAKSYSSAQSGQFVHGILANIVDYLRKSGKLLK